MESESVAAYADTQENSLPIIVNSEYAIRNFLLVLLNFFLCACECQSPKAIQEFPIRMFYMHNQYIYGIPYWITECVA